MSEHVETEKQERFSEIEQLVAMAEGKGHGFYTGALKTITVRLQLNHYAAVSALAEMGGTSMNFVTSRLIAAALEQVLEGLNDEALERFGELSHGLTAAHLHDETGVI